MQILAVEVAVAIEPGLIVETDGVHHERVAFPAARGIAHIGGIEILRMRPASWE